MVSGGLTVREAGVGDLDAVAELFRGYLDFYEVAVEDAGRPRAYLEERVRNGESLVLVAEDGDGRAVGFTQIYRTFSSLALAPMWLLNDLYVAPAGRRTGAGRALLRDALDRARAEGVAGVQLDTAYDNHIAQGLYEAEGFEREEFHIYFHGLGK
ncbi:GNAT family N-acetyltransferase [Streptomyces bambusae]|uniref:GNAT family N-acetyltransferase n=1 Tax=Streptomyces bambusae TaxID=1550616 RepID=UPI001CFC9873|nr:GNAT family N-acetyltransferase [Streptomyces bambusae]MCB5166029.1 GNAT family N-acetyltransferase [Streptomyces bambusae]